MLIRDAGVKLKTLRLSASSASLRWMAPHGNHMAGSGFQAKEQVVEKHHIVGLDVMHLAAHA